MSTTSFMQTVGGKQFYYRDPRPEDISIEDIAHSLSHICRFNGHTKLFYSVAEHSINVCNEVKDPEFKLCALLHDAHEAYVGDLISPMKGQIELRKFKQLEERVWLAVALKFGLADKLPPEVVRADLQILADEGMAFWDLATVSKWWLKYEPRPMKPKYLAPFAARNAFLSEFQKWR